MGRKVYVVGVGMTKFEKPGSRDWDYPDMAQEAGTKALEDAGIPYSEIEQGCVGYCYGDYAWGERDIYTLGQLFKEAAAEGRLASPDFSSQKNEPAITPDAVLQVRQSLTMVLTHVEIERIRRDREWVFIETEI